MFNFIKKHYLALALALLVGLLTCVPQYIAIQKMGTKFQGIYPVSNDDEVYYLARAKDVSDGHTFLANPYLWEHKNGDAMQVWLPDYLLAKPLSFFHISIERGFTIYDFIFPLILTGLSYFIIYALTRDKILSLGGAIFLHLGYLLYFFSRPTSPQFIFIFWLLTLLFFIKYIKLKEKKFLIATIFTFGLLFHFYPYFWTFYVVLTAVFILLGLIQTRKFNFKPFLYIILGAAVIGIPYFVSLYHSMQNPAYQESLYRLGMINTHFPSGVSLVALSGIFLLVWFICLRRKIITGSKTSLLLASGLIAVVICVNQHIVTGKNLEFSSHYLYLAIVWYVYTAAYLLHKIFANTKLSRYRASVLTVLFILVSAWSVIKAGQLVSKTARAYDWELDQQRYAAVFDWLNKNTSPDSVIYANQAMSGLVPLYTADNVFYAREANLFFLSDQEVAERLIINNYYNNITLDFVKANERFIWGAHYRDEYNHNQSKNKLRKLLFLPTQDYEPIPANKIEDFLALATKIKAQTFLKNLAKYRVDYLVFDSRSDLWKQEDMGFAQLVANIDDFFIYKVNR
ncbi:MAG: hypothetical protein C3F02_00340 [Parcubacteria group bacterium]|nr:MAG: hypothetical protein C3F02_00340 [Parcubacteria group bacterium]